MMYDWLYDVLCSVVVCLVVCSCFGSTMSTPTPDRCFKKSKTTLELDDTEWPCQQSAWLAFEASATWQWDKGPNFVVDWVGMDFNSGKQEAWTEKESPDFAIAISCVYSYTCFGSIAYSVHSVVELRKPSKVQYLQPDLWSFLECWLVQTHASVPAGVRQCYRHEDPDFQH